MGKFKNKYTQAVLFFMKTVHSFEICTQNVNNLNCINWQLTLI